MSPAQLGRAKLSPIMEAAFSPDLEGIIEQRVP